MVTCGAWGFYYADLEGLVGCVLLIRADLMLCYMDWILCGLRIDPVF